MLSIEIQKQYSGFHLDMAFEAGNETMGLLGASGCGKSVSLRSIAGIETPDSGKIVVNDKVFFDKAPHKKARVNLTPQERKSALLFQSYMLFPNLTVEDNVAAGIDKDVSHDERARIVETELARFGLAGFNKRYPAQLSGGQQQRVALARMLAAKPGILMLDEPFSALDAHLKGVLEQNLVSLFDAFNGTILYVSHDIDEALRFCDRIAVVDAGHIMEIATGDSLVNRPQSRAAIKLSGVKNETDAVKADETVVHLPKWGIDLDVARPVPDDVRAIGVREFYIYPADGPGDNNYRVRVDRVSESRFELTVLLAFLDRSQADEATVVDRNTDEIKYLGQHLFWRTDKMTVPREKWPAEGDEMWIHIDADRVYVVDR